MQDHLKIPEGPYQPQTTEEEVTNFWLKNKLFEAPSAPHGPVFSMVMPPPNITSQLHLGHALDLTLPDIIARYKRLKGFTVCWFPGTDQAGIATHNVVERSLEKEGIKREDIGREAFIEKVWEWKDTCGNRIIEQIKLLGISADWSRLRFTKDQAYEHAIRYAFSEYYRQGLIYKGHRIVNYCPRCSTALSDIEVDFIEENSFLYHIKYPIENTDDFVVVATTRPETMLGDTAVAVNPTDERYLHLIGKMIALPLTERNIPVIGDDHVEKDFGTGALKITPAHDPADYVIGKRHELEEISVIDHGKTMNKEAGIYEGLSISKAREAIVKDLESKGLLIKKEPYLHSVGHCSRCNKTVEPVISEQWYLKTKDLANQALHEVEKGSTRFIPDRWVKVYRDWMENIQDWCISRQIWWGVQIPVWYCECGELYVHADPPKHPCPQCNQQNWVQDEDVLDTWFGSALWPFAVMGWPEKTTDLTHYYPSSLLVTGFDIIFFWVARMLFSGIHFTGQVPFKDVYFHGLIRDGQGRKMSKSLNNGIDPAEMIASYGSDALRFTLSSLSTVHGQDICVDPVKIASSRNFINKIWNASRFAIQKITSGPPDEEIQPTLWDLWIQEKWNYARDQVCSNLEQFKFNEACASFYNFFWDDFCDWYIEISKQHLNPSVLKEVLGKSLILMHPFIPFITEKLWSFLYPDAHSILQSTIPEKFHIDSAISQKACHKINLIQSLVKGIRHLKSEFNLSSPEGIAVYVKSKDAEKVSLYDNLKADILFFAKIESLFINESPPKHAVSFVISSDVEIWMPLSGLIDIDKDIGVKEKKLEKLSKEMEKINKKMQNPNFMNHAPEEIIQETKDQHHELSVQMEHLKQRIQNLQQMKA